MSTWFEFRKSKEWFKQQVIIKKIIIKMKESEKTVKKIIRAQKIIKNNIEYKMNSEIIIINNISV